MSPKCVGKACLERKRLVDKEDELEMEFMKMEIDKTETKKINQYALLYSEVDQNKRISAVIAILVHKKWKKKLLKVFFLQTSILTNN